MSKLFIKFKIESFDKTVTFDASETTVIGQLAANLPKNLGVKPNLKMEIFDVFTKTSVDSYKTLGEIYHQRHPQYPLEFSIKFEEIGA